MSPKILKRVNRTDHRSHCKKCRI